MSVNLTCETYGDSSNPAVVLIHPFPFRAAFWFAIAPVIAESGFFVIAPNLRGCATSPLGDDEPNIDLLADDVWKLLDSLGVENPYVMGISLGGYVTLAMLRARPKNVAGLGLFDTKATADSAAAVRNRQRIASEIHEELSVSDYAKQMLPTLLSEYTHEHRPEVVEQVRTWISASNPHTVSWLQHAMASRPDSSQALAEFPGPVLFIRGADDVVSKTEDFEHMKSLAQHSQMIVMGSCAHLPPVEEPDVVATGIVNWLQDGNVKLPH